MIIDTLQNAHLYYNLGNKFKAGLEYIKNTDLTNIEPGKYIIADGVIANISIYNTKQPNECKPENHIKYADIQFIILGSEFMGYAPFTNQKASIDYNPDKDVAFYSLQTSLNFINQGMFAIFFPTDIHQPGINTGIDASVKKLVLKIEL